MDEMKLDDKLRQHIIETEQPLNNLNYFDFNYGTDYEKNLTIEQFDFSNALKNTKIHAMLRERMVDWIIEVYGNYP
jgi:cyclin B